MTSTWRARMLAWRRHDPLARLALLGVLVGSAVIELHRLDQNGYANVFYSAAVRSELRSWHNFIFLAFDPAGLSSVDKPPLGVWLQVASAKAFGFSPSSILVPEAVAAVVTVGALYGIVARRWGAWAGVGAALALAVFPSFAAVGRDNNVDALLIALMVLACGAVLRSTETGRLRWLLAGAILVGLAFNTKTLAAALVLPGLALAYLLGAPGTVVRRLAHLALAGAVCAVVSFSWIAYVDWSPRSHRPYVGSSTNDTEWNLTFSYNGEGRVGGQRGGPTELPGPHIDPASAGVPPIPRHGRLTTPIAFGGPTGPARLIGRGLGDQGGWLVPFAAVGLVALVLGWWLVGTRGPPSTLAERRRDPRMAGTIVFGLFFLAEALVLSFSRGIVHPYYVSALGPGVAALVGAGAVEMARLRRAAPWWFALPAAAGGGALGAQLVIMGHEYYALSWRGALAVAVAVCVAVLAVWRRAAGPSMAALVAVLVAVPAAYTLTLWDAPVQNTFPAAGPHQTAGHGGVGVTPAGMALDRAIMGYVTSHGPGRRWALLTVASTTAAPFMLMGLPAGSLGGYSGTDPTLDGPGLARLVARGDARYVLLGGNYAARGGNGALRAVGAACLQLPYYRWHPGPDGRLGPQPAHLPPPRPPVFTGHAAQALKLFDCHGRAGALTRQTGPA